MKDEQVKLFSYLEFEHLGNFGKILLEEINFEVREDTSRYLAEKYEAQVK